MLILKNAIFPLLLLFSATSIAAMEDTVAQPNLADMSAWYSGIRSVDSYFQQYSSDGTLTTGQLYIQRPDRLRMEYTDAGALVIVENGRVSIFSSVEDVTPEVLDLSQTPLWHLLGDSVRLARPGAVKDYSRFHNLTRITAYDTHYPDAGRMTLEFNNADGTMKLDGWKVRSALGKQASIKLRNPDYAISLPDQIFDTEHEIQRRLKLK